MIKGLIWDMDGVIIDSEPLYDICNKEVHKKLNFELNEDEINSFRGMSSTNIWQSLKDRFKLKESIEELCQMEGEENTKIFLQHKFEPIDGVIKILDNAKENGIKIALASSASKRIINKVLDDLQIRNYFDAIVSGEDMEKSKPNPEIFLSAAESINVDPKLCLVIEDSRNGVEAAKRADMKCVGFKNPNSGNQNLSKADLIVKSIGDIKLQEF